MANDDVFMSYVQVRGSVPLFWEQQGMIFLGRFAEANGVTY